MLLDSGKLQEEFAKREARWEKRHPDEAEADDRSEADEYQAAVELAAAGEGPARRRRAPRHGEPPRPRRLEAATTTEHVATRIEGVHEPGDRRAPGRAIRADLRAQPPHLELDLDEPLYTAKDAGGRSRSSGRRLRRGDRGRAGHPRHVRRRRAHPRLGDHPASRPEQRAARSGRSSSPATSAGPARRSCATRRRMTDADYVLVESTYGGREHEPEDEAIRILAETVRMVAESNGVLLVPSFAIGRTQEVVWQLDRLIERGEIPLLPLYLDSPMASKASDIYRHHPEYYDEETAKLLRDGDTPLDYPNQIVTNDVKASQAIARAPRPYMIVASNGMLTGGRVVGHLRNLIDDPTAAILFVGYQGEGTLGAHLQAGAKEVKIDGQLREVRCQDPLDQRLLGARRRERAARLARPTSSTASAGRPGLSSPGVPRPRRPGGPDRDRAEGPRARLRDARPALARARHARLERGDDADRRRRWRLRAGSAAAIERARPGRGGAGRGPRPRPGAAVADLGPDSIGSSRRPTDVSFDDVTAAIACRR